MKELTYPEIAFVNGGLSTLQTLCVIPAALGFYAIRQTMMGKDFTAEGGVISLAVGISLAAGIWIQDT